MNPETKLTTEQLKAICDKHHIRYASHSRITSGFSHEVHQLNDELIIKLYNTSKPTNFNTESAMLSSNLPFLKPQLMVADVGQEVGRSYIIMNRVAGVSLCSVWHLASDLQRENLIKNITDNLRIINKLDPKIIATDKTRSWQTIMIEACKESVDKLVAKKIFDDRKCKKTKDTIDYYASYIPDTDTHVVFWDIHFDNFIVNEKFELQAIIDLESTMLAALDYPRFVIKKMTDKPHKYLREDQEKFAKRTDYAKLESWYQKYYPEMFTFDYPYIRLKLYQLCDVLQLLQDWSHNQETWNELEALLK